MYSYVIYTSRICLPIQWLAALKYHEISPDGTGVSKPLKAVQVKASCSSTTGLLKLVMQLLSIILLTQMESWEYHMPEIARSCYILLLCFLV